MKEFNKLVRDRIPEIIEKNGQNAYTRILTDVEYKNALEEKLKEELFEEELKKLSEGIIDDGKPESEYYTENRLAEHHKRDGD